MSKKCIYCIVFVCDLYRKTECTSWETIGYNHINLHQNIFFFANKREDNLFTNIFFLTSERCFKILFEIV